MTQQTIIVGLGRTGLSCARYLHDRNLSFAVTDSREHPPEIAALRRIAPEVEVHAGGFDPALLEGASQLLLSPGVSIREPFVASAQARGIPVRGDIEIFAQQLNAQRRPRSSSHRTQSPDSGPQIVAITGTNGKSTVTTLVALMAEAAGKRVLAGGNLGKPALDLLDLSIPDLYVLELSSFQLETTHSLRTVAAAVLNLTPDHMDRYDTLADYGAAKAKIFDRCDAAVINCDDPAVSGMPRPGQRVLGFSVEGNPGAQFTARREDADVLLYRQGGQPGENERLAALSELKIAGLHNAANALAALALCEAMDLPRAPCLAALRAFPGLPHRSQWIADVHGVRFVDDSKGTNVGATLAAVAGLGGPLVLIAGGQGKGQDFTPLRAAFRGKVSHAVLIGEDAPLLERALEGACVTERAATMHDAVQRAARAAAPLAGNERSGQVTVLLSPACASLDMFRDYAHRGDMFAAAVRELRQ